MRRILALLILLAIPAVAQFGGPMGGMRPGSMQGGGLLPGRGGDPLWVAAGPTKPTLDFDFAKRKDLTDAVSGKTSLVNFSRSAAQSPGTYVGSDGLIHDAAVNLALYSEQFDQWQTSTAGSGSTPDVQANQAVSPDGKQTADKVVFDLNGGTGSGDYSFIRKTYTGTVGQTMTVSVWVRTESGTADIFLDTDNSNSQVITATTEWTRFHTTRTGAFSGSRTIRIGLRGNASTSDSATVYIWGAQLEETDAATMAPTAYIKTTSQALAAPRFDHVPTTGNVTTNLSTYSEMLDTQWSLGNMDPVEANQEIAPDGTTTADKLIPSVVNTSHYFYPTPVGSLGGGTFTFSAYVKAAGYPRFGMRVYDGSAYRIKTTFDIESGIVVLNEAGTPSIESVGDGWFRVAVTGTSPSGNMGTISRWTLEVLPETNTVQTAFAGDGTSGAYVWGVQIEKASTPGPYVRTLSETRSISDANAESLGLLVEEARANLVGNSNDLATEAFSELTTAGPTASRRYWQANQKSGPDDSVLLAKLVESTNSDQQRIYKAYSVDASTVYTWSGFFGAAGRDYVILKTTASSGGNHVFNLSTGQIVSDPSGTATMTDFGDGIYRCSISFTTIGTTEVPWVSLSQTGGTDIYTGDGVSGIYAGMLQLEKGSFPTSYIPTTGTSQTRYADVAAVQDEDFSTTNLLSYSESFDVGWNPTGLEPIVANDAVSPDGQTTADKIIPTSASGAHDVHAYPSVTSGTQYALTVYAKPAGYQYISLFNQHSGTSFGTVVFDVQNGTVTAAANGASTSQASISSVGNGWFRAVYMFTATATSASSYTGINVRPNGGSGAFVGNGTDGAYLWGASLTATEYPVDYVTTRNLLTDSQDFERGTWYAGGVTVTPNDTTAPDGTLTADKLTVSPADTFGQQVTVPTSQQVTFSTYIKRGNNEWVRFGVWDSSGGTPTGSSQFRAWVNLQTKALGTQSAVGSGVLNSVSVEDVGNDWLRLSITGSLTGFQLYAPIVVSAAADNSTGRVNGAEWYLWGAQLEPGTTATEYVRTVDVVGKDYGWYEPTEGTVFVGGDAYAETTGALFGLGASGAALYKYAGTALSTAHWWSGSSGLFSTTSSDWRLGVNIAGGYGSSGRSLSMNGDAVATAGSTIAIGTRLQIGMGIGGVRILSGHIKRLTYWPRRQSDSTLQVITQ